MQEVSFVKGYQHDEKLRKSFNLLATLIFGIEFESWYQKGYWRDKYIPYSFVVQDQVVANVSVNLIDMTINNSEKSAVQIGTVMTHPDHRGKGYSQLLMNKVLTDYANADLFYLFANETVLDFYPKFGFQRMAETSFIMEFSFSNNRPFELLKLDGRKKEDLDFIYQHASNKSSVSHHFGTKRTEELFMFYCMNVFFDDIYFIKDEETLAICRYDDNTLHLFDIISKRQFDLENIINALALTNTVQAVLHFTPDDQDILFKKTLYEDDTVLFIKNNSDVELPEFFKHPITSQA